MKARGLDIGVFGARGIPSTYSGFETFLTALLPALVERGHEVTMYCRKGSVEGAGPYMGVKREFLPAIDSKSLSTLTHGAAAAVRARRSGHDVILAVNVANAVFCGALRAAGQKVALNTDGQEWLRGKWGPLARRYFLWSAQISRRCANVLISDCEAMQQVYRDQFQSESVVIPYCWTQLEPQPDTSVLRAFDLTPRGYALIAARLIPENNVDRIVEAFLRSDVDEPIVVLGAANYDSPVTRRIAELAASDDRCRLLGHIDNRKEYASLVANAMVYFHGHSVGGINPSLIEAMGCGALVAALDTPFNREALGDSGFFFSDVESSTSVLAERPWLDPESDAIRERARQRASTEFALDAIADAYEQVLVALALNGTGILTAG